MLDRIEGHFHEIGDELSKIGKAVRTKHPSGVETTSFTPVKIKGGPEAPEFQLRINKKKNRLEFAGCPLLWLQGHNGLGSNDLPFLVEQSIVLVFQRLGYAIPGTVQQQLRDRSYGLSEVHVAELHRMRHALIDAFCENIRRFAPPALRATPLEKGIGIRLWPDSRVRTVLMYDKFQYYLDGTPKHRRRLLGKLPIKSFERLGPNWNFNRMLEEHLNQGIRIETRHKRSLRSRGLDAGDAWTDSTAREIHHAVLADVPIDDLPPVAEAEALLERMGQDDRRLVALWLEHRDVPKFFDSSATYHRWRKRILAEFDLDLSRRPISSAETKWSTLTSAASILETPRWAIDECFLHDPQRYAQGLRVPPSAEAWPPPRVAKPRSQAPAKKVKRRR
ncbi:MAG: hypothetical protein EON54_00965 [Alcaligenaceae bacterium]|nr:MAG: hypothetical protein EON54_00965 [Alcaligenaceae bacterium]